MMRSLLDWSKGVEVRRLENKSFAICAVLEAEGRKFDAHLIEARFQRMVNMDQKDGWAIGG